jgi:hypothetical protein
VSPRNLVILIVAALAVGLLAVLLSTSDDNAASSGGLLLPDLAGRLNDVDRVVVTGPGNEAIATLERSDGAWRVTDNGYAADVGRLRKNLIALSEARIREIKTANPEFYERLGVVDISDDAATGVQLELAADEQSLGTVLVGDTGLGAGNGAYVRVNGDAQSYLIEASLDPGPSRSDWLDREIVDVPSSDIRRVSITQVDGETLELEKISEDATEFVVLNVPDGRELSFPGVGNSIGAVLAKLQLEDVQPADEFTPPAPPIVARFETFDGLAVEAHVFRVEDDWRVTLGASAIELPAGKEDPAAEDVPEAESDKTAEPRKSAADRATAINARTAGWLYTLPGFKSDQLIKRLEDLLAAPSEE